MIKRMKYQQLAYCTPRGKLIRTVVEDRLPELEVLLSGHPVCNVKNTSKFFYSVVYGIGVDNWSSVEANKFIRKWNKQYGTKLKVGATYPYTVMYIEYWFERVLRSYYKQVQQLYEVLP